MSALKELLGEACWDQLMEVSTKLGLSPEVIVKATLESKLLGVFDING